MMKLRTIARTALLLAGLVLTSLVLMAGGAHAETAAAAKRIIAEGKPTVLIVSRAPTAADRASEAYADWSAYLNEFAAERREAVRFVKIAPRDLRAIFAGATPVRRPFATIFIRDAHNAIYYDGMIHEPIVYRTAAAFLSGTGDPRAVALGLKPFRFRLRR